MLIFNRSTAKLEQKIESLVTLLASAQGVKLDQLTPPESLPQSESSPVAPHLPDVEPRQPESSLPWPPAYPTHHGVPSCGILRSPEFPGTAALTLDNSVAAKQTKDHFSSDIWKLSDQDGDRLLNKFRENFFFHFPFILVPPNMSSSELRSQKPYLLKAIWTITFQDGRTRQIEMSKDLMVDISTSMLIRGDKDMDMLECLVLLNAWFVPHYVPSLTPYVGIAMKFIETQSFIANS